MTLAGTPATTVLSGTFSVTTAPAATTEFSPTVTPGNMVALAAIHALRLITTGFKFGAIYFQNCNTKVHL